MLHATKDLYFDADFAVPSCVPPTKVFETSGAEISSKDIEYLFREYPERVIALGEVMDTPGVLNREKGVMEKIGIAKKYGKPICGHAPYLTRSELKSYHEAGPLSDHEVFTYEEAIERDEEGMWVELRESPPDPITSLLAGSTDIRCELAVKKDLKDKYVPVFPPLSSATQSSEKGSTPSPF